jgi:transposase
VIDGGIGRSFRGASWREAELTQGRLTDAEWRFFERFVIEAGSKRGRPPADHRRVLDGIFWIARTGSPWRDVPEKFGKWSSVYRQFLRWTQAGLWDILLEALADSEAVPDTLQMSDATTVRAHHHAADGKGGVRGMLLAARAVAIRRRSIFARTHKGSRSAPPSRRRSARHQGL